MTPAARDARPHGSHDVAVAEGAADAEVAVVPRLAQRRRGRPSRRIDRGLLIASFAIAVGIVIIVYGVTVSVTGDEGIDYPSAVEQVDPVPNAVQVPNQTSVFVDLEQGYIGVLVINGIEIPTFRIGDRDLGNIEPGRQVDVPPETVFEPGNATLTFTPSEGALVEGFSSGIQQVDLIFWREAEGRHRASTFTWTFNVV